MIVSVALFLSLLFSAALCEHAITKIDTTKVAILITIAGKNKLSQYFEWGCKSIGHSKAYFDMLIFHEGNSEIISKIDDNVCASNVKFINLGENGISRNVVSLIMKNDKSLKLNNPNETANQLTSTLTEVVTNIPKYLVEIKPMLGELFSDYLSEYTHWSYSDPDILWGSLPSWIEKQDLDKYDIVSLSPHMDAGRLYLRGQMTIHKNSQYINTLWRELPYFSFKIFISRISNALRDIKIRENSDDIFSKHFYSAEGLYSAVVLDPKRSPEVKVKICGRSFDDYSQLPIIFYSGKLFRCLGHNITSCIDQINSSIELLNISIHTLPKPRYISASSRLDENNICKMKWLPAIARQCIVSESFSQKQSVRTINSLRLIRVGEAVYEGKQWNINNEMIARRGEGVTSQVGAFFHFKHWNDVVARGLFFQYPTPSDRSYLNRDCMVIRIRVDNTLAYETCSSAIEFDQIKWKGIEQFKAATRNKAISNILNKIRKVKEGNHHLHTNNNLQKQKRTN